MIKVYGASKLRHVDLWKRLYNEWTEIHWTARWPWEHVGIVPDSPEFAILFWQEDQQDVERCDVVLVYAEPQDKLRGALIEAGMGIAYRKRIIVVGQSEDYGTWQYHPAVERVETLDDARRVLNTWSY